MKRILKSVMLLVVVITMGFGLQNCTSTKPIDKSKLSGYWVLKSLNNEDAKIAFKGPIPSLEFDFEKSAIYGSGGCNRYTGGFTLNDKNEFSAPHLASTMMMCVHENKEGDFLAALSTPSLIVTLENDNALVFSLGKKRLLEFEKGEQPQASGVQALSAEALVGAWTLTSINGEDVAKLFSDKKPSIEFDADGKVFGNGGCNSYRGTFKLEENTLSFGPLMSTKMACPSLEGEGKFMQLLASPVQATINGETLTFLKDGNVVLEFKR